MQSYKAHLYQAENGKDFILLGYPMHLTPTEFRILSYFSQREGTTVDADALLAHCYHGKQPDVSNVSVRISLINQKAARIGGRRLIRFVRGRGYKFCDDI